MTEPVTPCPSCGQSNVTVTAQGLAQCNACGAQFFSPTDEPEAAADAAMLEYRRPPDDAELSELHIRNISNLRRGAYRERSYWIIAGGFFLVGAIKLIQIAWIAWARGLHLASLGDMLGALAAGLCFVIVAKKIALLTRELNASRLSEPQQPPDFSNLGDGSQRVHDLETLTQSTDPAAQAKSGM